jgi:hypothetical protein
MNTHCLLKSTSRNGSPSFEGIYSANFILPFPPYFSDSAYSYTSPSPSPSLLAYSSSFILLHHRVSHFMSYDTASHCIILYHTVVCITMYHTISHCIVLFHTFSHCITLYHTVSYCLTLHISALLVNHYSPQCQLDKMPH